MDATEYIAKVRTMAKHKRNRAIVEEKMARYGPLGVPLQLENERGEIESSIKPLEDEISKVDHIKIIEDLLRQVEALSAQVELQKEKNQSLKDEILELRKKIQRLQEENQRLKRVLIMTNLVTAIVTAIVTALAILGFSWITKTDEINISNLEASSDNLYSYFTGKLEIGHYAYVDRKYKFSNLPDDIKGEIYIATANNDKWHTNGSFLNFNVDRQTRVYVAHSDCYTDKPSWLTSRFRDTGKDLEISGSDDTFSIFEGIFDAGNIVLGGNTTRGEKKDCDMYIVILSESN